MNVGSVRMKLIIKDTAQLMWGACMCLQIPNSCLRYGFALDYTEEVGLTDFTCPRRWRIMFNCLFVVAA